MDMLQEQEYPSIKPDREDNLIYDLGLLTAHDPISINAKALKDASTRSATLLNVARDDMQLFFNRIFELPTQKIENGVAAKLPKTITKLPREKPVPKPKPLSKWQKYAKEKGIKKKKKEYKVYDAATDEFKPTWGNHKVNQEEREWILPAKETDKIGSDPFLEKQQAKKERIQKNKKQREENSKRAQQSQSNLPATISVSENKHGKIPFQERKKQLQKAFSSAQTSTISMGKFDKLVNEETRPKMKRKLSGPEMTVANEKSKNLRLLDRVLATKAKVDVDKAANKAIGSQQKKRSYTMQQPNKKRRK